MKKLESYYRINCNSNYYSDIAIKNYYKIKHEYIRLKKCGKDNRFYAGIETEENMMICCIFSEMALESFFNDYAASRLGDDEFYDEFGKLTTIGKFQLIVEFIIRKEFDKSQSYYSSLKSLKKIRNELVHNKSQDAWKILQKQKEEIGEYSNEPIPDEILFDEKNHFKQLLNRINDFLTTARKAIKAMVEIVKFFEQYDESSVAGFHLMGFHSSWDKEMYQEFCQEFHLKCKY